jgi:hypothetical protein
VQDNVHVDAQVLAEAASLEDLASVVEARAARVLQHAEQARQEAERADHDSYARELRTAEASTHEHSAELLMQTAALYRGRARDLRKHFEDAAGPRHGIALQREHLDEERAQIATVRKQLAAESA